MSTQQAVSQPRVNSAFKHLMQIHWAMAICYLVLFIVGILMPRLPEEFVFRDPLYDLHKSIGALVMALLTWRILTLLRVWWRKYTRRSPRFTKAWWAKVALHTTLYFWMWAVPTSGFFLSNSYQSNNVKFFGIPLPDLFPQNSSIVELARSLHFWFAYAFLVFIVLHILVQKKVVQANWRRFFNQRNITSN